MLFVLSARSVGYVRISVGDTLAIHVLSTGVQKIFLMYDRMEINSAFHATSGYGI